MQGKASHLSFFGDPTEGDGWRCSGLTICLNKLNRKTQMRKSIIRMNEESLLNTDPLDRIPRMSGFATSNERFGVTAAEKRRAIGRAYDYLTDDRKCSDLVDVLEGRIKL